MYAHVTGLASTELAATAAFDDLAIDVWHVRAGEATRGKYVSIHPRISILFDGAEISLTADRATSGATCSVCYVPPGLQLWGQLAVSGHISHLDIHISRAALIGIVPEGTDIAKPLFLPLDQRLNDMALALSQFGAFDMGLQGLAKDLVRMLFCKAEQDKCTGDEPWLERVKRHILQNIDQPMKIDDLAELAGLSRTQFNRLFRQETGHAPYQWITHARITKAQGYLQDRRPFVDVATATGFSDQAHLTRTFKSFTGQTPGKWLAAQTSTSLD
ncbi:MAG: helix-turn-helix domain-containing protein [Paracoccaceae bacterium]